MGVDSGKGIFLILTIFALLITLVSALWFYLRSRDIQKDQFIKPKWRIVIPIILVIGLSLTGYLAREHSMYDYNKALAISVKQYDKYVTENTDLFTDEAEYGQEYEVKFDTDLWSPVQGEELVVDTTQLGSVTKIVKLKDEQGFAHEFTYNLKVEDTQFPTLANVKDIELQRGEKFDESVVNVTAEDPVDGELEVVYNGFEKINTAEPDSYDITATTLDKNGNRTVENFNVIVRGYTNEELVEIIWRQGSYGNGVFRQSELNGEGYDYAAVQALVNEKYGR